MREVTNTLSRQHYKEITPEKTLLNIKRILSDLDIILVDDWVAHDNLGCSSMRSCLLGTRIGTNGKGVKDSYTMASSYAEFLERLQNDMLTYVNIPPNSEDGFQSYIDERWLTTEETISDDNSFSRYLTECLAPGSEGPKEQAKAIDRCFSTTYDLYNRAEHNCRPFYSLAEDRIVYIPADIAIPIYGSNGMCAGNSSEEALVQGLSEIYERLVTRLVNTELYTLPDVPDKCIQEYPRIWTIFEKMRSDPRYSVVMKDCSLGGRYPVAGLIVINNKTNRFGVKYGSHPDFGIAMERTMTEALQGRGLEEFSNIAWLNFDDTSVNNARNVYNSFKLSIANYSYRLFSDTPSFEFVPPEKVKGLSNGELLRQMLDPLLKEGHDILIRDVSYLGLPAFQVIVPTISEMNKPSPLMGRATSTMVHVGKLLRNPKALSTEDIKLIIRNFSYWKTSHLENTLSVQYNLPLYDVFPYEEYGISFNYMLAMCYATLGEYDKSALELRAVTSRMAQLGIEAPTDLLCIDAYLDGRAHGIEHSELLGILAHFFESEVVGLIDGLFCSPDEILIKQYPQLDCYDCGECEYSAKCDYRTMADLKARLKEEQKKSPLDQNRVRDIVKGL